MKNLIILIAGIILQLNAIAQTNIRIILRTDLKIDSVNAFDVSFKESHSFHYKDTLDIRFIKQNIDLYNIHYFVKGKMYRQQVWLDTGNITIKAHTDKSNLIIDTVINSPVYYSVINYLRKSFGKDTIARNNFMIDEIKRNLENPRSIAIANDYVSFNQNSKPNLLKLKMLLSKQKTDFSWFIFYAMSIERMNKILEVKDLHLSDFKFVNRENKSADVNLDKYDYYILDFWFVGCTPCMAQHKQIKARYQELRNKKITVIGISIDKNYKVWNKYLSDHGYKWDNYLQAGTKTLSNFLGIVACPVYVVLNKKGDIISSFGSLDDLFKGIGLVSN
jgi:peroxiredoxin